MKVIFTDTVKGVAFKGDVRTVKPGHFRNYLLPQGKAVVATPHTLGLWNKKRSEFLMEKEQVERQAVEVKERLASIALTIEKKVTTKGTLYSAITEKDIFDSTIDAEALKFGEIQASRRAALGRVPEGISIKVITQALACHKHVVLAFL